MVGALLLTADPAFAARARPPRPTRQHAVRHRLNLAKASDAALARRIAALEHDLVARRSEFEVASRRASAASDSVRRLRGELLALQTRWHDRQVQVTARAVAAYERADTVPIAVFTAPGSVIGVARRNDLLSRLAARDADALDQLAAAHSDLESGASRLVAVEARARARERAARASLTQIGVVVKEQHATHRALQHRIDALQHEVDAIAAEQPKVEALLRRPGSGGGAVDKRVSAAGMHWPIKGRITSGFGRRWRRLHAGIDIAAHRGTPIHVVRDGVVVFAGRMGGYGNFVIVQHSGGIATCYAHQSRIAVRRGQRVHTGDVIGYVGSTGHSTGNHLHFEVRIGGAPRNPRRFLP